MNSDHLAVIIGDADNSVLQKLVRQIKLLIVELTFYYDMSVNTWNSRDT